MRAILAIGWRWLPRITAALLAGLALALAARLAFRADPRDDLRRADALFRAARFYDARAAYTALAARAPALPEAWLRLGMLGALRGEPAAADRAFLAALAAGAAPPDQALIRLYQGQLAARAGRPAEAAPFWSRIEPGTALFGPRTLLEAELRLAAGDYPAAESGLRTALERDLPPDWRRLAHARLALLRASSDPSSAQAELALAGAAAGPGAPGDLWLTPLLPADAPSPAQIAAALAAPPDQRAQLLGQIYLAARLFPLAEAQFASIPPDGPGAPAAAAYAAYTRWQAGDHAEGLRRLGALVQRYPADPRARALLALASLASDDFAAAQAQLAAVGQLAPRAPDLQLAWGQWYAAQHDYPAAAAAFARARSAAPPDQQGSYALALARFHIATEFLLCEAGQPAAEAASRALPASPEAWSALAAAQLGCGQPGPARSAAEQALALAPSSPEAAYYLGRAQAALGDRSAARLAFVRAADSAPASEWRARAEQQIGLLGLS